MFSSGGDPTKFKLKEYYEVVTTLAECNDDLYHLSECKMLPVHQFNSTEEIEPRTDGSLSDGSNERAIKKSVRHKLLTLSFTLRTEQPGCNLVVSVCDLS